MDHLKKYENWFTDIFKSKEYDTTDLFMQMQFKEMDGMTTLMHCATNGDIKKFKNYFNEHITNEIDKFGNTTLVHVATGKGSLKNKKEMIKMLIDNGENPFRINDYGKTFLDEIKDPKLYQWIIETFPDIEFQLSVRKYNL